MCNCCLQFHFDYKDCLKDDQVLCKWQLEYYDKSGTSGYSHSGKDMRATQTDR